MFRLTETFCIELFRLTEIFRVDLFRLTETIEPTTYQSFPGYLPALISFRILSTTTGRSS